MRDRELDRRAQHHRREAEEVDGTGDQQRKGADQADTGGGLGQPQGVGRSAFDRDASDAAAANDGYPGYTTQLLGSRFQDRGCRRAPTGPRDGAHSGQQLVVKGWRQVGPGSRCHPGWRICRDGRYGRCGWLLEGQVFLDRVDSPAHLAVTFGGVSAALILASSASWSDGVSRVIAGS